MFKHLLLYWEGVRSRSWSVGLIPYCVMVWAISFWLQVWWTLTGTAWWTTRSSSTSSCRSWRFEMRCNRILFNSWEVTCYVCKGYLVCSRTLFSSWNVTSYLVPCSRTLFCSWLAWDYKRNGYFVAEHCSAVGVTCYYESTFEIAPLYQNYAQQSGSNWLPCSRQCYDAEK